jgi:EAL domain-containing protein (putative c-di-GMP-specific phosphodiesterase class I)
VIAEGVEDSATLDAVGCHAIQGYYISRPIAPSGFDEWLAQQATTNSATAFDHAPRDG